MAPDSRTQLPRSLRARYSPSKILGSGGFGTVLLAEDRELGRRVAIKLLHANLADEDSRQRFQREARITAQLEHPYVVRVFDYGVDPDGIASLVYEYIPGGSLAARRESSGPLSVGEIRLWGSQIAEALAVAHSAGVLHRDVKPENILLREDRQAVLCDFGIARGHLGPDQFETQAGQILGTPSFLAPEILLGEAPSPASDQFALGATLWELVYGEPVYGTRDLGEILAHSRSHSFRVIPTRTGHDPGLGRILLQAVAARPGERFPDLRALGKALLSDPQEPPSSARETILISAPSPKVTPIPPTNRIPLQDHPIPRKKPKNRGFRGALIFLLGMILLLVAGGWWKLTSEARFSAPAPGQASRPSTAAPKDPDTRALEDLEKASRELDELHQRHGMRARRLEPGQARSEFAHIEEIAEDLLGDTFELRYRAYLKALGTWSKRRLEDPEGLSREDQARMRQHFSGRLGHLRKDLGLLIAVLTNRFDRSEIDWVGFFASKERRSDLLRVPGEYALALLALPGPLPDSILAYLGLVSWHCEEVGTKDLIQKIHRRILEAQAKELTPVFNDLPRAEIVAMTRLARTDPSMDTWEQLSEMIEESGRRINADRDEIGIGYTTEVLAKHLQWILDRGRYGQPLLEDGRLPALSRLTYCASLNVTEATRWTMETLREIEQLLRDSKLAEGNPGVAEQLFLLRRQIDQIEALMDLGRDIFH